MTTTQAEVDELWTPPSTRAHLDALTALAETGHLVISAPVPTGDRMAWKSRSFPIDEVDAAAQFVAHLDDQDLNLYLRTNLIGEPISSPHRRGSAADTSVITALAVDIDIAGPAHRQGAGLPLPEDLDQAKTITAELPTPTLTIHTGGGAHLWWILDEPVTEQPIQIVEAWADGIVEAGRLAGLHVDRPDPARVLRVAGTTRRKPGLEPNDVILTDVAGWPPDGLVGGRPWLPSGRYGAKDLLEALPKPSAPAPPTRATRPRRTGEFGPADAVAMLSWAEILEPLGWTYQKMGTLGTTKAELWKRPGDPTSDYSIKAVPDGPCVAWSDACGLPTGQGQRLSKWRVYVALHASGDEVSAAREIRALARRPRP